MENVILDRSKAVLLCQKECPLEWGFPEHDQLYAMRQNGFVYFFIYHADSWDDPKIKWGTERKEEETPQITFEEARKFFKENATPGDYGEGCNFGLI